MVSVSPFLQSRRPGILGTLAFHQNAGVSLRRRSGMQMTRKLVLGGALAMAVLVGCGGNSSGGGFTTSVPSGTKLTSLTPQQATQLCTDFDAYAQRALTPDLCKLLAIEATALSLSVSSTAQPS